MKYLEHLTLALLVNAACFCGSQKMLSPSQAQDFELSERIVKAARDCIDKEMWHGFGLKNGYLGCAAAVSNVLKTAGVKDVHSAGVVIMRQQLLKGRLKTSEIVLKNGENGAIKQELLLEHARPGDILLAFMDEPSKPNTGGNAHCGIMNSSITVCTNDWNDGIWKSVNVHSMFDHYRHVRLLRLLNEPRARQSLANPSKPSQSKPSKLNSKSGKRKKN